MHICGFSVGSERIGVLLKRTEMRELSTRTLSRLHCSSLVVTLASLTHGQAIWEVICP